MAKKGKKRSSHKKNRGGFKEPSVGTIAYRGPPRLPRVSQQAHVNTIELTYNVVAASTIAGGFNLVYGNSPSVCSDWTSVASLFDEYRTLSFRIKFVPISLYSQVGIVKAPLMGVIDRDSFGNLASYDAAQRLESCRLLSWEKQWTITAKMNDIQEATFLNTAAPADNFWIKFFSGGNSVSTQMGYFFFTFLVQFKGRI